MEIALFVATHEHRHGLSNYVEPTYEGALAVKTMIAREWWSTEMEGPIPEGDTEAAEEYFDAMSNRGDSRSEYFTVEQAPISLETIIAAAQEKLWRKQLEVWPDSRRVPVSEVITTWNNTASALQYPAVVFYEAGLEADGTYRYKGIRYGLEDREYLSGFY